MAGTITIRVNDNEEEWLNRMAAIYGMGKSSLIKRLAFEKLEDEYDIMAAEQAYRDYLDSDRKTTPVADFWRELDEEA